MMKNLSSRLAPYNISVNDVSPAMVGSTGLLPSADSVPGVVDNIPLQRLCAPEEVANVVLMYARTGFATVSPCLCSEILFYQYLCGLGTIACCWWWITLMSKGVVWSFYSVYLVFFFAGFVCSIIIYTYDAIVQKRLPSRVPNIRVGQTLIHTSKRSG
jgi:hypothetical protein